MESELGACFEAAFVRGAKKDAIDFCFCDIEDLYCSSLSQSNE